MHEEVVILRVCLLVMAGLLAAGCTRSGAPPEKSQVIAVAKAVGRPVPVARWTFSLPSGACAAAPLIHEDTVFVADLDGGIYALDVRDRELRWKVPSGSGIEAKPIRRGSFLYVGNVEGRFHCLDASTGQARWTFPTAGIVSASPSFYADAVLIPSQDTYLYCLSADKGDFRWKFKASHQILAPAVVVDEHYCLVVGSCSSLLHVIDSRSGEQVRQCQLRGEILGAIAVRQNRAVLADMRGNVSCIDWKQGKEIWAEELNPAAAPEVRGGATLCGDLVLVGSSDRFVRAFDFRTGQKVWEFRAVGPVDAPIQTRWDQAFVTTTRGVVHVLNVHKGTECWRHRLEEPNRSAVALGGDCMVAAGAKGTVVCFDLP